MQVFLQWHYQLLNGLHISPSNIMVSSGIAERIIQTYLRCKYPLTQIGKWLSKMCYTLPSFYLIFPKRVQKTMLCHFSERFKDLLVAWKIVKLVYKLQSFLSSCLPSNSHILLAYINKPYANSFLWSRPFTCSTFVIRLWFGKTLTFWQCRSCFQFNMSRGLWETP